MIRLKSQLTQAKLDRKKPLRDQIYPLIRDLLLTGVIKPGDAIDEKAIAQLLNISRTPVREAVKKLSDEHLVDVIAQSGTRASRIDAAEIEQAYLIRRALEIESAARAAPRMNAKHAEDLESLVAQHEKAIAQRKFVLAVAIDDRFHRAIALIAELPRLWHMIEISKAHLDRCRHILQARSEEANAVLEQHRAIIAALVTGNSNKAAEAMRNHLEKSYDGIARLLAED